MSDLSESLRSLAVRIEKSLDHVATEEATKTAFVLPFISALGYDVFNPIEVTPELDADIGIKKGEKIDYAIMRAGEPIILFECKSHTSDLGQAHKSQLYRYFSVTNARLAVLTNGIDYWFFSDLDHPNRMDDRPFLVFNVLDIPENLVHQISRFSKEAFNIEALLNVANELKAIREIREELNEQLMSPSEEFVRLLASKSFAGRFTPAVKEQYSQIVQKAFQQFINDRVRSRLSSALGAAPFEVAEKVDHTPLESEAIEDVMTTEEELEGFHIVKAIIREVIGSKRITPRDVKSYFGILIDDNNRKPICRLRFNQKSKKFIGICDVERNEVIHEIASLDDIYLHSEALKAVAKHYA